MSSYSGTPRLPTRCPVCKGAVIQRISGRPQGLMWFKCHFCSHTWKFRLDDARAYPDGELEGDVIVTLDGKRHSLGGVVLNAIPEEAFTEHLQRRKAQSERETGRLQREIDSLAAILKETRAEEDRLWNIQKLDESDMQKANAWSLVYNKTKSLASQLEDLRAQQQHLTSGEYFLQDVPAPISTVQTNADGKFTLLLPRVGRYAIVARASRQFGEQKETYCWFVWVSLDGAASKRLSLNNSNVVGAGSPDSAVP